MVPVGLRKLNQINLDSRLVGLAILFFILRPSMPLFKYPFIALFLYLFIRFSYLIIKGDLQIPHFKDLAVFGSGIAAFLTVILAFSFSEKHYLLILKEIIGTLIIFTFYLFFTVVIKGKNDLDHFVKSFLEMILSFAFFISIAIILNLFGIIPYKDYFMIELAQGETLPYDYNFGLLPVILAVFILLYYLIKFDSSFHVSILLTLAAAFFTFTILISESTRGFIVIVLLNLSILIFLCLPVSTLRFKGFGTKFKLALYLVFSILILFSLILFITRVGFIEKNRFLNIIGTKEILETKETLSNNLYKQYSLFNKSQDFTSFHRLVWSINFDPMEPDKGWAGIGAHKTIGQLSGTGSEMIPLGAKGCLLDKTCRLQTWDGDSYSITQIGRFPCDTNYHIQTSVYCYVSDDFNGDWVKLILLYTQKKQINREYDLSRKGTWQKLEISDRCNNEPSDAEFYFAKLGVTDFSSLNGYVIIAYPEFKKINKNGEVNSLYHFSSLYHGTGKFIHEIRSYKLDVIPSNSVKAQQAGLLNFNIQYSLFKAKDSIRVRMKKKFSEDTTYIRLMKEPNGLKNIPLINDSRLDRWKFAVDIFLHEYNFKQKIFGRGFVHLNWYGNYFLKDKLKMDWPHNPFLSVLLYSGILGLVVYIIFLFKAIQLYLKYINEYPLLFIFFLVTFFFSFLSGGSPFDPPIMGFFMIFPFFIKYIQEKDNTTLEGK